MSENNSRIYVAVAATVQSELGRDIVQPAGRQIAQACHVVSKLRNEMFCHKLDETIVTEFEPITTIILQARDSKELLHIVWLLNDKKLNPVSFYDDNWEYGPDNKVRTAIAVLATEHQVEGILDYLPLWRA